MNRKHVNIAGRHLRIFGNPDDQYLDHVDAFVGELRPLEAWARAHLPADATVLDVGGNIGVTALLLSALLPHGHVHVFEALPSNVEYLKRNIAENDIGNCTVNASAAE